MNEKFHAEVIFEGFEQDDRLSSEWTGSHELLNLEPHKHVI